MITLFSYRIPVDDGAAPNPYGDVCTLVICKPKIRKVAQKGDWVIGTGSKNAPGGKDFSNHLVYAMKITEDKLTLQEYDVYCRRQLRSKIPDIHHKEYARRVGDCIYDYSNNRSEPLIRPSVHNELNRQRDLSGEYALLSKHFYYFGRNPVELPEEFSKIIKDGQGHKSRSNDPYAKQFIDWLEGNYGSRLNQANVKPQIEVVFDANGHCQTGCLRLEEGEDSLEQ